MRSLLASISIGIVIFAATCSFAGVWVVNEGVVVGQGSGMWTEVLPAEDMDATHPSPANIDWGSKAGSYVRFWPSWNWNYPVAGDTVCWLYDRADTVTWWHGSFNNPTTTVVIQLDRCDSNDGWVDVYVDGTLEFSYDSYHATTTQVQIVGTNLSNTPHQVKLQTRSAGGTLSINYVATSPAIPTLNEWGMVILILLLVAAATVIIRRRRRATA